MKKLLVFIVFFLAFFSIMSIRVYASTVNPVDYNPTTNSDGDNYKIDTRSKKQALYSIWQVFMDDFDGEVKQRDLYEAYDSSIYAKPLSTYEIVILQSRLGDPL